MSHAPLILSATRVAEFFRFGCERQLRWDLVPPGHRTGDIPQPGAAWDGAGGGGPGRGAELLWRQGREWEQRKLRHLVRREGAHRVALQGWGPDGEPLRLPSGEVAERLREPINLALLLQPELLLPDPAAFRARWGFDAGLTLAAAVPDAIRVRRGSDGNHRLQCVEIKASRGARVSHIAQLAFYTLMLQEFCLQHGIRAEVDRTRGWIWTRGDRKPRRVPLGAYRHHVIRFLSERLGEVACTAPAAARWHVAPRCPGCAYLDHCSGQAEAEDDLCLVPGISVQAKQVLRAAGIGSVKQLSNLPPGRLPAGCHSLDANARFLQHRALALRIGKTIDIPRSASHLMPPREDIRVVISVEGDPVTGLCFAVGVRIAHGGRIERRVSIAGAGTPAAEVRMLEDALSFLERSLGHLTTVTAADRRPQSLHLYLWDGTELALLRDLITRSLGGYTPGSGRGLVAGLLAATRDGSRGGIPATVLEGVVASLFALPVAFAYDLASVSEHFAPRGGEQPFNPPPDYRSSLSSQIPFARIHEVWEQEGASPAGEAPRNRALRERMEAAIRSKLDAISLVADGVQDRAARGERLQLRATPIASLAAPPPLASPALETLRRFAEMEAAAAALSVRALHALPAEERARRFECIRGMEFIEHTEDGNLLFKFDRACREVKFRPGDFNLLLTADRPGELAAATRHPYRQWAQMAELVGFDLAADPPRVTVAPANGFARAQRERWIDLDDDILVLDRALTDYNTDRILSTLGAFDAPGHEHRLPLALLRGEAPAGWVPPFSGVDEVWAEVMVPAARRYGRPVLNPEQDHAWRAAFKRCLTVFWGPPGTGKTYLLAWMLIGLAHAARRTGRPCRLLVSAVTHRAIANVLVRIRREISASGAPEPLRIVKLRGSGSEPDAELAGEGVELAADRELAGILADAASGDSPVVVGATVWSVWKQMKRASAAGVPVHPLFDVVVLDEASQIKVAESLIALSALRGGGQVIMAGDDRQLAPIIHGRYAPERDTLLGSAFTHFGARFNPLPLQESGRMNDALIRYPRKLFYPGFRARDPAQRLRLSNIPRAADAADQKFFDLFLQPDDAVVLCTYPHASPASPSAQDGAQRNAFEAACAARLARLARERMIDPDTGQPYTPTRFVSHGFAVISPHRAQASAILGALRAAGFAQDELPVVDTVERMQGNEREMIVVSYAVADPELAEAEAEFLLNPNRFNVSITRPRSKLVVFLSEAILQALPQDEAVLSAAGALLGYPAHCSDAVRRASLPSPAGDDVAVTLRYRRLKA